jgi:predicted MPP superfamily phosphohydrolase
MSEVRNRPHSDSSSQKPARRLPSSTFIVFLATIQSILLLGHWFIYKAWTWFRAEPDPSGITVPQVILVLLSFSFVGSSLLAYRYANLCVRLFYRIAATWLGFVNFFFLAACFCWLVYGGTRLLGMDLPGPGFAVVTFAASVLVGLYGIFNAQKLRVKKIAVKLRNLPTSWHGRTAALVSDTHLGHVNGVGFMRKLVRMLRNLEPDIIFIAGDLFDGTQADFERLVAPWKELCPPQGAYFVTGNHEEFSDRRKYLRAVAGAGIRALNNEKVTIDGLQLLGIHDRELGDADQLGSILDALDIDRTRASILLAHVPQRLAIFEQAGISLQLSGHTHGGQIFPFTRITRRIFGEYTYGLNRFRELIVYTSSGAGTWGPPMRVGTKPEIVSIRLETA